MKLSLVPGSILLLMIVGQFAIAQQETPAAADPPATRLSPELLWKLGRLGEAAVSPDGSQIAYTVRHYELEKDKGRSDLHLIDAESNQSVLVKGWSSLGSLQWGTSKNGARIFFIGMEGKEAEEGADESDANEESPQAWSLDPATGNTLQVTNVEDGIANLKVSPTGTHIAFTRDIKMDQEVKDIYADLPKADARIIDGLMYRHWNAWHDYKYSHLHVAAINADGTAEEARDLMDGVKADCPVPPFGGAEQFNWSPDGTEIAYTLKNVERWAESTDSDVFTVDIAKGADSIINVSKGNQGYDNNPVYSPDGKYLAFSSMERASFESDRNRIMIFDRETGAKRDLTVGLDQTSHDATWTPDSKAMLFVSEFRGTNQIFKIELDSKGAKQVSQGRYNWSLIDVLPDGDHALVSKMNMLRPKELAVVNLNDSTHKMISNINGKIYKSLELPTIEERWVEATDGKKIHCWVILPPDFDAKDSKKWPLITYCQGGPQGQIGQWFSYRWNFHLMAAQGYIIVAPNRRGLPGFGREWNDQISGDWGGQAMKDILSATDAMTKEPYVDTKRTAAIGASFGGYTVYWLMGNHNNRFQTMIAHCGVFNLESMYGSTEELFFVNWDLGGPYWNSDEVQKDYDQFSPHRLLAIGKRRFWSSTVKKTSVCLLRKAWKLLLRPRSKEFHRDSCTIRTKATGCSSRKTASCGTASFSTGWHGTASRNRLDLNLATHRKDIRLDEIKAQLLLMKCQGNEIWSVETCRQEGLPADWIEELIDNFESGFDDDRNTIYVGDQVTNQYRGVPDLRLAYKLAEFLGVDWQAATRSALGRRGQVKAMQEAFEEG